MGTHSKNLFLGVFHALSSIFLFSFMDALIKWMGDDYPVHQLMFFRCVVALVPVAIMFYMAGGLPLLKTEKPLLHVYRSLLGLIAMVGAFYGFTVLPLADASSVFYTAPLFAIAFSTVLLKEKVGIRRWSAVVIGLLGVLVIIRPGGNVFNIGGMAMFSAAVIVGAVSCLLRLMSRTEHPITTTFYFTLSGAIIFSISCFIFGWVMPDGRDLLLLMMIGVLGGTAQYGMTSSFRYADVGLLSPLRYLSIVVAGGLGFLIWQEVPDMVTVFGILMIVISGVYSMLREASLARKKDKINEKSYNETL